MTNFTVYIYDCTFKENVGFSSPNIFISTSAIHYIDIETFGENYSGNGINKTLTKNVIIFNNTIFEDNFAYYHAPTFSILLFYSSLE